MASLSDLLSSSFRFELRPNWTPVYVALEKRWCAFSAGSASANPLAYPPPSGTVVPAAYDLRTKSAGYDLQTDGARWFSELQKAVDNIESSTVASAGTYMHPSALHFGIVARWLDPDAPWATPSGFLILNSDTKLGYGGRWRRKKPREIAAVNANADTDGNAAVAGQRAYLWPASQPPPYVFLQYGPRYRCVAAGNWVRDDSQVPDLLDSDNPTSGNAHTAYGLHRAGDYMSPHLWAELCRRIQVLNTSLQIPFKATVFHEPEGTSDRQVPIDPDDPSATAIAYPSTLAAAETLYQADYHTADFPQTGGPALGLNGAWWNAEGVSRHGLDEFDDDGYSVGGFRRGESVVLRATIGGNAQGVLVETSVVEGAMGTFDGQGTGLTLNGLVTVGGAAFGPAGTTGDIVILSGDPTPLGVPTYPPPPATGDGLHPYDSPPVFAKGFVGRVYLVVAWDYGSE